VAAPRRAHQPTQVVEDEAMAKIPESTRTSLQQRLAARARERWPQITRIHTRYRASFAYVDATLTDGDQLRLCRLRYAGSAHQWGFAIYRASHDDYEDAVLPTGFMGGTAEDALDTACGLYLGDSSAWT
jgi:choline dehydrogenase-like flavoprotein